MSVLDDLCSPDFDKKLDRVVLGVNRVENDFTKIYENGFSIPVMIDPLKEFDLHEWATREHAVYIDLATVESYDNVANSLFNIGHNFVMDNIDSIPDGPDKEYLEELVRFILKREIDFPLPNGKIADFSICKCAMRANAYPEYLAGKSLNAIWLRIPDPGKEMEYEQLYELG